MKTRIEKVDFLFTRFSQTVSLKLYFSKQTLKRLVMHCHLCSKKLIADNDKSSLTVLNVFHISKEFLIFFKIVEALKNGDKRYTV
jgi:hypothetical protein